MGWISSSQGIEADGLLVQIDDDANQPVRPILIDGKAAFQDAHTALVVRSSQKNDRAGRMLLQVESPVFGKGTPGWRRLGAEDAAFSGSNNILGGTTGQSAERCMFEPQPDLGLPKSVETFDGRLEPVSLGGANTGMTPRLKHNRITRPIVSAY